jgi:hypothetical protein
MQKLSRQACPKTGLIWIKFPWMQIHKGGPAFRIDLTHTPSSDMKWIMPKPTPATDWKTPTKKPKRRDGKFPEARLDLKRVSR